MAIEQYAIGYVVETIQSAGLYDRIREAVADQADSMRCVSGDRRCALQKRLKELERNIECGTDNMLKAKDRDVFYTLEEVGILTTTQDQIIIKKGKTWRIHYWELRKDEIFRLANLREEVKVVNEFAVYDDISEDVWSRE